MRTLTERYAWNARAACLGAVEVFEAADVARGPSCASVVAAARAVCAVCPCRTPCFHTAMQEEEGQEEAIRFGLRGGVTPAQRVSIERRGIAPADGQDPLRFIRGDYGHAPIPDHGDQWTKHHTTLARKVVRWLVDKIGVGEPLPPQEDIAATLGCTVSSLRRVMEVLVADGTLALAEKGPRGTTKYVRSDGAPKVVGSWLPPHLRGNN